MNLYLCLMCVNFLAFEIVRREECVVLVLTVASWPKMTSSTRSVSRPVLFPLFVVRVCMPV